MYPGVLPEFSTRVHLQTTVSAAETLLTYNNAKMYHISIDLMLILLVRLPMTKYNERKSRFVRH